MAVNPYTRLQNQFQYQPYDWRPMMIAGREVQQREEDFRNQLASLEAQGQGLQYLTDYEGNKLSARDQQIASQLSNEFNQKAQELTSSMLDNGQIATPDNRKKLFDLKRDYAQNYAGRLSALQTKKEAYSKLRESLEAKGQDASWAGKNRYLNEVKAASENPYYIPETDINFGEAFDRNKAMKDVLGEIETFKRASAFPTEDGYIRTGTHEYRTTDRIENVFDEMAYSTGMLQDMYDEADYKINMGILDPSDRDRFVQENVENLKRQAGLTYETSKETKGLKGMPEHLYKAEEEKKKRLQTIYSKVASSIVAPSEIDDITSVDFTNGKLNNRISMEAIGTTAGAPVFDLSEVPEDVKEIDRLKESNNWMNNLSDQEVWETATKAKDDLKAIANKVYNPTVSNLDIQSDRIFGSGEETGDWSVRGAYIVDENGMPTNGTWESVAQALGYGDTFGGGYDEAAFNKAIENARIIGYFKGGQKPGSWLATIQDEKGKPVEVEVTGDSNMQVGSLISNQMIKLTGTGGEFPLSNGRRGVVISKINPNTKTYDSVLDIYDSNGDLIHSGSTLKEVIKEEEEEIEKRGIAEYTFKDTRKQ